MLQVNNIHKYFKKKIPSGSKWKDFFSAKSEKFYALKGISFAIEQGEKVAFIGPNGAGKSTMIKSILGILHPNEGEISLFGLSPQKDRKKIAKLSASVFGQRSQLLYHLPLIDSFHFFKIIYEIPEAVFQERLDYFVQTFGIASFLHQPVRKLSLGQRMKGEIIAALLHKPKVIFLDEPTVGLDIVAKKVLYAILNKMHKEEKLTIFLTSHDLNDIENLCERALVINKGQLLYDGELKSLITTYANRKEIAYKEQGNYHWDTVEIPNEAGQIEQTIRHLFKTKQIEDITIKNPALEEIIEQFYV